jgi:hypothetical protein
MKLTSPIFLFITFFSATIFAAPQFNTDGDSQFKDFEDAQNVDSRRNVP